MIDDHIKKRYNDLFISSAEQIETLRNSLKLVIRGWMTPQIRRRADSSDLIQETLLITLSKFSYLVGRPKREVYRWMLKVMRHRVLKHAGRAGREVLPLDANLIIPAFEDGDILSEMMSDELRVIVLKELEKYDPVHRQIFELHYFESLDFEEIGKIFNSSASAVRSIHFRTLSSIRPRIEKQFR
jgi:RNA polymerase sigma factor (sigma-70 family)